MTLRDELKQNAPIYFAATLFAPEDKRDALVALYSFDFEIKRIPFLVSEPMLGEIRLQWWREALNGERAEEARMNPLADAVLETINHYQLPLSGFHHLIDGEAKMLDGAPLIDERELETSYGQRYGAVFQLASMILDHNAARSVADASGHAAMAYGIARDLVSGRHAVTRADLMMLAETHLNNARSAIAKLPDALRPAFLPLVVVEPVIKSAKHLPAEKPIALPSYLAMLWRMLRFKI
jgi:phytoene synthase